MTNDWASANQRYLVAALDVVRERLVRRREAGTDQPPSGSPAVAARDAAATAMSPGPAIESVCRAFGLSSFERDVLLLCAGVELDAGFAADCAAAHADARIGAPTFGLALAVLPEAHWSALSPAAPLRYWRLVEIGRGDTLVSSPLRIDERVLHHLTGVVHLDERLLPLVDPLPAPEPLGESRAALAERIARAWRVRSASGCPTLQLVGGSESERRALAAEVCRRAGLEGYVLRPLATATAAADPATLLRLWQREAVLCGAALVVEADDLDEPEASRAGVAGQFVEAARTPLVLSGERRVRGANGGTRFELPPLTVTERCRLWREALGEQGAILEPDLERIAGQFPLDTAAVRAAAVAARVGGAGAGDDEVAIRRAFWRACRGEARPRVDHLAQRIEPRATWDDLVVPAAQRAVLRDVEAHCRQRVRVHDTWGFARKSGRGLGLGVLFSGPSGTGKTMAAEVLANELDLDLYRIDLSQVVSKYIGETEKNLSRIFRGAGGAILLFDEADALFGKRSDVKDSHDRYANLEVSYLLQRMEEYDGLAILTTNVKHALDPAFMRRLRFVVQFPFPDAAHRAEIWRRIFPAETPTEAIDPLRLAQLNVAGGHIRNIALNAAFIAAEAGEPVRMTHVLRAARVECGKLERPLTEREVQGWA